MELVNLFGDKALNAIECSSKNKVNTFILVTPLLKDKRVNAPEQEVLAISAYWYLQVEPINGEVHRNFSNFFTSFCQFVVCCRNVRNGLKGRECK